jgi:Uma2 family endonuclease
MTDDDYFACCTANPDLQIERTSHGEIVIAPPAGGESGYRTIEFGAQLRNWARRDARGRALGSIVEFLASRWFRSFSRRGVGLR